jgi:hypothetical protein
MGENLEIIRRGVEAANRDDLEGFLIYLDPDIEIRTAIIAAPRGRSTGATTALASGPQTARRASRRSGGA